ncbi:hypothetical protein ID866_12142 [Astraeus odoratus]|nr:hypothetical protein ID866_12142 [Astraeus odoratus]
MFLLNHPAAFSAVQDEVDKALKDDFGDLQTFLTNVNPKVLERPSFKLLISALLEAMRLIAVFAALRIAEHDLELKDSETTIPVRKGEYVMGNIRAIHMNANTYHNCNEFCKGRYLAVYEMKLSAIFYPYLFDITPTTEAWWLPRTVDIILEVRTRHSV